MMEIEEIKNGEVPVFILWVGDLPIQCSTEEEAKHLQAMLALENNWEIHDFLLKQWDNDILKALKKQNKLFKMMLIALLESGVYWQGGIAENMVIQAADYCRNLQNQICPPAPAWHASLKEGVK